MHKRAGDAFPSAGLRGCSIPRGKTFTQGHTVDTIRHALLGRELRWWAVATIELDGGISDRVVGLLAHFLTRPRGWPPRWPSRPEHGHACAELAFAAGSPRQSAVGDGDGVRVHHGGLNAGPRTKQ